MVADWRLVRGGEILATLRPDGMSLFPGDFTREALCETTPAFEPVRRFFEREIELLDVDSEPENAEWAEIWDELKSPGLFVESADGRVRLDVAWIHIKDGRAWWWPLYKGPSPSSRMPNPRRRSRERDETSRISVVSQFGPGSRVGLPRSDPGRGRRADRSQFSTSR